MKVELKADERDGCVATITGCGVGGHTATFRFLNPEYAPDPIKFDGDSVLYARDVLHGDVICTIADDAAAEVRATLEAYEAPRESRLSRKAKQEAADDPDRDAPRGAVTADAKEVVQGGDVAGDSQFEAAGDPGGEAVADPPKKGSSDRSDEKGGDGKPNS